jgi:Zn-dependent metalloprotease
MILKHRPTSLGFLLASTLFVGAVATGCAPSDEPPEAFPENRVARLSARLEQETGVPWVVEVDSSGEPSVLAPLGKVSPSFMGGTTRSEGTRSFLSRFAGDLGDPDLPSTLEPEEDQRDDPATVPAGTAPLHRVRFALHVPGSEVRVHGADVTAHFDSDGSVVAVHVRPTHGLVGMSTRPSLTEDAASRLAVHAVQGGGESAEVHTPSAPRLVVHRDAKGRGRLAYRVVFVLVGQEDVSAPEVFVDAMDGAILETTESSAHAAEKATAKNFYSYAPANVVRPFDVSPWSTVDVTTGSTFEVPSFRLERPSSGRDVAVETRIAPLGQWIDYPIVSYDRTTYDENPLLDPYMANGVAVSVYDNLLRTVEYARDLSILGFGNGKKVVAVVHRRAPGGKNSRPFGAMYLQGVLRFDDARTADDGSIRELPFGTALEVVAHEFFHGVVALRGVLGENGEAGALNEAVADVFAAGVKRTYRPKSNAFRLGEDIFAVTPTVPEQIAIRDMREPRSVPPNPHRKVPVGFETKVPISYEGRWPTSSSEDRGYVHANSAIASHAYFLMSHGGAHATSSVRIPPQAALGWDRGQRLWLDTVVGLAKNPQLRMIEFARVQAGLARGKGILAPVVCGWHAVGVFSARDASAYGVACERGADLPDSCGSRADGYYCSDLSPGSAIACRNGGVAGAAHCSGGRKCRKTVATASPATFLPDGSLACDP